MKEIISPVDTEDGLFHDGDPSTGTEGTVVSAKWLNPVQTAIIGNQQELASVLKEAGIKIDPSKQNQLLAAIKKITGTATEGFLKAGAFGLGGGPVAKTDAYSNIAQFYRVNDAAANKPPITGTAAGVVCLPIDGAPSTGYLAISIQGDAWIGRSGAAVGGVTWNRIYTMAFKPTAADINAYTKQEADGRFAFKSITVNGKPLSSNVNLTAGDVNAWSKTEADGRYVYKTNTINGKPLSSNITLTASDIGLGNVGNFTAIQQGGGQGMLTNKVYIGWSTNKLTAQVDNTPLGELFYKNNPPKSNDVGLGNVGNFMAIQQGGGANQTNSKIYIGWGNDGILRCTVDSTDLGQIYTTKSPQPIVQLNQDNIGSLAFARLNPQNSAVGYGGLVSGSSLSPAGVTGYPAGGNWAAIFAQESTLPGTWKCLGQCISDTEGGNRHFGSSLFVRVS
ncbi:hypothetical protein [uncultured Serratia sp.]|uniref:hypothetical protein n=1 Tax=uncultured Serratia sp. TaxID=239175 RepID=UPI0025831AD0|nr:hypothetical protein [uncultured Serratia sp.]